MAEDSQSNLQDLEAKIKKSKDYTKTLIKKSEVEVAKKTLSDKIELQE